MQNGTSPHEAHSTTLAETPTDKRILVVDEDDILRGLEEAVLNSGGYKAEGAANGEEALAMLATGGFDLLLTSHKMPGLDGLGLIRSLRSAGNSIPVFLVSDGANLPAYVRGEIAVVLLKPVTTRQLLAGVAEALHRPTVSSAKTSDATANAVLPGRLAAYSEAGAGPMIRNPAAADTALAQKPRRTYEN
jgi:DNA-binding response OmpR family regulator